MLKKILFLVLFLVIVASACDTAQQPAPNPNAVVDNTTQKMSQDGLTLSVKTDKEAYSVEEEIKVHAELENTGKKSISYSVANPCEPDYYVYIDLPAKERIYFEEDDFFDSACVQVIDNRAIVAKQKITRDVLWDSMLNTVPQKMPAFPGKYALTTIFSYIIDGKQKDLIVINNIEIKGEAKLKLTKEKAIRSAYKDDRVIEWYNAHVGKALVEEEYGKYYIISISGRDRIDNTTAQKILESEPTIDAFLSNNLWTINFMSLYGEEPLRLSVIVDAISGETKDVRFIGSV
ncbi:MAG: hypothetical protein V1859_11255 [archaeon]